MAGFLRITDRVAEAPQTVLRYPVPFRSRVWRQEDERQESLSSHGRPDRTEWQDFGIEPRRYRRVLHASAPVEVC